MYPNSIYLDRKLFPPVGEVCVLTAAQFMNARVRGGPGPHTIRADMTLAAFDGTSLLGNEKSYLIGAVLSPNPGTTLLRQRLGPNAAAFEYAIFDPVNPDVVTFTGPRAMPKPTPEGMDLARLDDLLLKFPELSNTNRALVGMLKYCSIKDPAQAKGDRLSLGNGWSVKVAFPWSPMFLIFKDVVSEGTPENTPVACDPEHNQGGLATQEPDDCAPDNSYSLAP